MVVFQKIFIFYFLDQKHFLSGKKNIPFLMHCSHLPAITLERRTCTKLGCLVPEIMVLPWYFCLRIGKPDSIEQLKRVWLFKAFINTLDVSVQSANVPGISVIEMAKRKQYILNNMIRYSSYSQA